MSNYLDGTRLELPNAAPLFGGRARARRKSSSTLTIGLVNNMPDSALVATERQFAGLIESAAAGPVKLVLYHLPGIPRGDDARAVLAARYRPIDELYTTAVDALIVTGNEPKAKRLEDEPYWPELARLTDWARDNTATAAWSCLAAHAAVLHLDRIERRPLAAKRSGVFTCVPQATAAPLAGLPAKLAICHSRFNEVRAADLAAKGYRIVSESPGGHVDIFTKSWGSQFVFLQGHPEYDSDSLMREYRRDTGRYLHRERDIYPELPANYFAAETVRSVQAFREVAERARDPALFANFPRTMLRSGLALRLQTSAGAVFGGWLANAARMAAEK